MDKIGSITAKISGIKYAPLLCRTLSTFDFDQLSQALSEDGTFILNIDGKNKIAVSYWVSSKRSRSYPYSRIYDSLNFLGKKVTIIPIFKDEGFDGDRDFLQWDTISLMSLLGVYVVVSYYQDAERNIKYENKITNQRFDIGQVQSEIKKLLSYQSDALHWNLEQINNVGELSKKALQLYDKISRKLGIKMHSKESAENRIKKLLKGKEVFIDMSRKLAHNAQKRESVTIQPKEKLTGIKAILTIKNYLGGYYYFTVDEVETNRDDLYLIEAKNSKDDDLPSLSDVKEGLFRMILFTNLEDVKIDDRHYNPMPILKLTTKNDFDIKTVSKSEEEMLNLLKKEADSNGFKIRINNNQYR